MTVWSTKTLAQLYDNIDSNHHNWKSTIEDYLGRNRLYKAVIQVNPVEPEKILHVSYTFEDVEGNFVNVQNARPKIIEIEVCTDRLRTEERPNIDSEAVREMTQYVEG